VLAEHRRLTLVAAGRVDDRGVGPRGAFPNAPGGIPGKALMAMPPSLEP